MARPSQVFDMGFHEILIKNAMYKQQRLDQLSDAVLLFLAPPAVSTSKP